MAESSADRRTDVNVGNARPSRALLTSLHPSGDPGAIRWIEGPEDPHTTENKTDVVVVAMNRAHCRDAGQREAMIARGLSALAPGGILWVDAPGPWRSALAIALRGRGLAIGSPIVLRARGAARAEFSLTSRALRFALSNRHVSRRWRLVLAVLERVPWGRAMLFRLLPSVGFAAFHAGTKTFGWLVDRLDFAHDADVAVTTSWRGEQAPFLIFALGKDQTVVVKRGGPGCHAQIAHEAAMLKQLGAGLAKAGLEVPRLIDCTTTARFCSLFETHVPGRPMDSLFRDGRHRDVGAIAGRLAEWLTQWNRQTLRYVELTPALGELLILSAARELAGTIERGSAYVEWLSGKIARLIGHKVPLVAAHNDLTMANVLGDVSGIRSVIDWEAADPDGLPLTDFRYASCDAATAIGGGNRLAAFRACFVDEGEPRQRLQQCEARLRAVAGGPPEWLELCVHAGWLRHAANEQARSSSPLDRAFIAIANLLADGVVGD
jgi:hypothetical protein